MRFITEFELSGNIDTKRLPHIIPDKKYIRELGIGQSIGLSFGWKETGFLNSEGLADIRHTLEIEAFPMDKWIEFKNQLFNEINECHKHNTPINGIKVLEAIKQLESFGKPAGAAKEL